MARKNKTKVLSNRRRRGAALRLPSRDPEKPVEFSWAPKPNTKADASS